MRHIALVGKRKSGKSTAASFLTDLHGYTKIALADPLKDSAVDMLNYWFWLQKDGRQITREELDEHKAEFRPLLEWLGTPFGRDYLNTPMRWLDLFAKEFAKTDGLVVVDDVRQPNEATYLRELGFLIVRIERSDRIKALYEAGEPEGDMPSEKFIDLIQEDVTILNNGTVGKLHEVLLWTVNTPEKEEALA